MQPAIAKKLYTPGQDSKLMSEVTLHKRTTKLTESTSIQKAIAMHLK